MIVGALVLPVVTHGMTEASMTRKPVDAVHPEARVDDGHRVGAHLAGADRVEDVGAGVAGEVAERLVGRDRSAPALFPRRE